VRSRDVLAAAFSPLFPSTKVVAKKAAPKKAAPKPAPKKAAPKPVAAKPQGNINNLPKAL